MWEPSGGAACKEPGPSSSMGFRKSLSLKGRGKEAYWAERLRHDGGDGSFARAGIPGADKGEERDVSVGPAVRQTGGSTLKGTSEVGSCVA